jgi:putative membrane protein
MRTQTRKRVWGTVAGAAGGVAAAFVMNQFQAVWAKAEKKLSPPPPEESSNKGGDDATVRTAAGISKMVFHHELTAGEKKWAGPAVHYAFGGMAGALYGAMANSTRMAAAGGGTGYGSAVWLLADEIGVPAAGLSGPPTKTPPMKHLQAWASHLVYGLVTEGTRRGILKVMRVR